MSSCPIRLSFQNKEPVQRHTIRALSKPVAKRNTRYHVIKSRHQLKHIFEAVLMKIEFKAPTQTELPRKRTAR